MSPTIRSGQGSESVGRDVTLYWWGQTTSALGSVFTAIALPVVAVVHFGASPGQIALIAAAAIIPTLLFGLPAGVLADRITRPRRTLMALDAFSALAIGVVALGLETHVATIAWLVVLNVLDGAATVLVEVVYFLHLRQLVGPEGVGRARARLQAGQYGAGFVGRLLAGPLIVFAGSAVALSVDAVSYVLSATALLSMRPVAARVVGPAAAEQSGVLSGVVAGIRYLLSDTFKRTLMVLIVVPVVTTTGIGVLTAPFLLRVVHVPTSAYGMVFIPCGVAGLAGSVLAGRLLRPGRDARTVLLATFTAGVACGLLVPLSGGPLPLAMTCAALGMALPAFFGAIANVALGPVIVADTPEEMIGRMVASLQVFAGAGGLAGTFAAGALGDAIGIRPAMWTMGIGSLAAILLCVPPAVRANRGLRAEAVVTADLSLARTPG